MHLVCKFIIYIYVCKKSVVLVVMSFKMIHSLVRDAFTAILMFSHNVIYYSFLIWVASHAAFGLLLHLLINMIRCGVKVCSPLSALSLLTGENISIILFYLPLPSPALTSTVNSAGLRESPDPHLSHTHTCRPVTYTPYPCNLVPVKL